MTITEFPVTDHFISVDVISWFSAFLFLSLSRGHRLEDKDPVHLPSCSLQPSAERVHTDWSSWIGFKAPVVSR